MKSKPKKTRRRSVAHGRGGRPAAIERLVTIMDVLHRRAAVPLRDREQTHESLRAHLVEETYEVLDAIDRRDLNALPAGRCAVPVRVPRADWPPSAAIRLRGPRRGHHRQADSPASPRVHASGTAATRPPTAGAGASGRRPRSRCSGNASRRTRAVRRRRAHARAGRRAARCRRLRANEIGRRVAAVGFEWPTPGEVADKIDEEVRELREAIGQSPERAAEEFGDCLFSIAQLARKLGIEPEAALRAANEKFARTLRRGRGGTRAQRAIGTRRILRRDGSHVAEDQTNNCRRLTQRTQRCLGTIFPNNSSLSVSALSA